MALWSRPDRAEQPPVAANPSDWLPLQQAACELNISVSTARRRVRKGELRSRIVPRRGGFSYLVYVPGSRHARIARAPLSEDEREPRDIAEYVRSREKRGESTRSAKTGEIARLEAQIEHLSEALSRALRIKQKALPAGMGEPSVNPTDPYARYRWLTRRRRWWPF